jgi:hypothetical protein
MGNCVAHPKTTSPPFESRLGGREDFLLDPISNMSTENAGREQNNAFVYHGREGKNIPRGVIRVRVHPSIRVIRARAFL